LKISTIILTLNASLYIKKQIQMLKKQTLSPDEIIIIDSSSTDDTCAIARNEGIEPIVIPKEKFSHGGTRNFAAKIAKGDILVFFSQDAIPYDNYVLEHLIKHLYKSDDIVASYGRHVPYQNAKPTEIVARKINYPEVFIIKDISYVSYMGAKTFFFSNVCSAIKKDILNKIGGFPEDVFMSEDTIFAAKAINSGYKIVYVPEAKVLHSHDFSPLEYFKRYYYIGRSLSNYKWIIQEDRIGKEGRKIVKSQINYILKTKQIKWLPYLFIENSLKYLGFKLGLFFPKKKKQDKR